MEMSAHLRSKMALGTTPAVPTTLRPLPARPLSLPRIPTRMSSSHPAIRTAIRTITPGGSLLSNINGNNSSGHNRNNRNNSNREMRALPSRYETLGNGCVEFARRPVDGSTDGSPFNGRLSPRGGLPKPDAGLPRPVLNSEFCCCWLMALSEPMGLIGQSERSLNFFCYQSMG